MGWVRNIFIDIAYKTALFTIDKESKITNIINDRNFNLQYSK